MRRVSWALVGALWVCIEPIACTSSADGGPQGVSAPAEERETPVVQGPNAEPGDDLDPSSETGIGDLPTQPNEPQSGTQLGDEGSGTIGNFDECLGGGAATLDSVGIGQTLNVRQWLTTVKHRQSGTARVRLAYPDRRRGCILELPYQLTIDPGDSAVQMTWTAGTSSPCTESYRASHVAFEFVIDELFEMSGEIDVWSAISGTRGGNQLGRGDTPLSISPATAALGFNEITALCEGLDAIAVEPDAGTRVLPLIEDCSSCFEVACPISLVDGGLPTISAACRADAGCAPYLECVEGCGGSAACVAECEDPVCESGSEPGCTLLECASEGRCAAWCSPAQVQSSADASGLDAGAAMDHDAGDCGTDASCAGAIQSVSQTYAMFSLTRTWSYPLMSDAPQFVGGFDVEPFEVTLLP